MAKKKYWLFKTEPGTFSWDDLLESPDQTTCWEGVRNYQARNFMRDDVKVGDGVLFYHSRVAPMAVFGPAKVVKNAYADDTQFDPKSSYYDPKAKPEEPRWIMVDVKADKTFKRPVTLEEMKSTPGLEDMKLVQKGMRLSVQPVSTEEWKIVVALSKKKKA